MNFKLSQSIGLCLVFICCNNIVAMQQLKQLSTVHSGIHCLHKLAPVVHGPQMKVGLKNNVLKLGASLSTLALMCHIGSNVPAPKK